MKYYNEALKYEGAPYKSGGMSKDGIDCSGLVNVATGQKKRVWHTALGKPCGNWSEIFPPKTSHDDFLKSCKQGDLFLWNGHTAFYAGDVRLFHARRTGTKCGYTNDLKLYWLKQQSYPRVFREV